MSEAARGLSSIPGRPNLAQYRQLLDTTRRFHAIGCISQAHVAEIARRTCDELWNTRIIEGFKEYAFVAYSTKCRGLTILSHK